MNRSKKIFLIVAAVFLVIMLIIGWDMARRTTFPGSKSHLKEEMVPDAEN